MGRWLGLSLGESVHWVTLTCHSVHREERMLTDACFVSSAVSVAPAGSAVDLKPPRGTRDFPPEEMRARNWLFGAFHEVARSFGFEEWDAPVLESEELYVRKAGEEITSQLFNFEDKGGRRVSLRPELTPSLTRIALAKGASLPLPAKWYAVGQCWRYERTTRGRRREHYQWNMDVIGAAGVSAEAELLAAIAALFTKLGLSAEDVGIKVSSRKLLQGVAAKYGVEDDLFAPVCIAVDKLDKIGAEKVSEELAELGVATDAAEGILRALAMRSLDDLAEELGEESEVVVELRELWALCEGYGIADWLVFDASVVRGLAYYTGTVFEAFDRAGELRAICGGGRYDTLLQTMAGGREDRSQPMVGFGFGDAVIMELLSDKGLLPEAASTADDVIAVMDAELRPQALGVAARLRAKGRRVDVVLDKRKFKWIIRQAERVGAQRLLLVGQTEWDEGKVRVKNLAEREEDDVPLDEL